MNTTSYRRLGDLPLWRLLVALDDAERTAGPDSPTARVLARAIRENKPEIAYSNFYFAGPMTEAILLGNVAIRAGKKLEWDSENFKITNLSEAEKYLRVVYREGWKL